MLEEHHEQLLLDRRRRVVERQQVGEGGGVAGGLGQDPVLVERGDDADRLGHQAIGLPDHVVPLLYLRGGEPFRVALRADLEHPVPLGLPRLGGQAREVGRLDRIEPSGRLAFRVEHTEALQDRDLVGRPLLVLGEREAHREEAPRRADLVVAAGHVAVLAGRRRGRRGERPVLLEQRTHAVLAGRVHLPLRVVEPHVAGLTGLGLLRLLEREGVTGVAGVAGGVAEGARPVGGDLLQVGVALEPDLVAAAATLHPVGHRDRLGVDRRHRLHCGPGQRVLPLLELRDLRVVADGAGVGRRQLRLRDVVGALVLAPVAGLAADRSAAVLRQLPVLDDLRGRFEVAADTGLRERGGSGGQRQDGERDQGGGQDQGADGSHGGGLL